MKNAEHLVQGTRSLQKQPIKGHNMSGLITRLCCAKCFPSKTGNCGCFNLGAENES